MKNKTDTTNNHNLSFVGELEYSTIERSLQTLNELRNDYSVDTIDFSITSSGGYFYSAFAMYDYIAAYPKPINTLASGTCHSSAILVLQAGKERLSYQHTIFRFHKLIYNIPDYGPLDDIRHELAQFELQEKVFLDIIACRSNIDRQKIKELCERQYIFGAKEALQIGLIDGIRK